MTTIRSVSTRRWDDLPAPTPTDSPEGLPAPTPTSEESATASARSPWYPPEVRSGPKEGVLVMRPVVVGAPGANQRMAEIERLANKAIRARTRDHALDVVTAIRVFDARFGEHVQKLPEQVRSAFVKYIMERACDWGIPFLSKALTQAKPFADKALEALDKNPTMQARVRDLAELQRRFLAEAHQLRHTDFAPRLRETGDLERLWKATQDDPDWRAKVEALAPRLVGLPESTKDTGIRVLTELIAAYEKLTHPNPRIRFVALHGIALRPEIEAAVRSVAEPKARVLLGYAR